MLEREQKKIRTILSAFTAFEIERLNLLNLYIHMCVIFFNISDKVILDFCAEEFFIRE